MKENTKKKIKKVAKIVGVVATAILATIGAFSSVALLTKCGGPSEEVTKNAPLVLAERPKPAYQEGDDMFGEVPVFDGVALSTWTSTSLLFSKRVPMRGRFWNLPVGTYLFVSSDGGRRDLFKVNGSADNSHIQSIYHNIDVSDDYEATWSVPVVDNMTRYSYDNEVFVNIGEGDVLYVSYSIYAEYRLYNVFDLPAVKSFSFPSDFFPYQLTNGSPIYPTIVWESTTIPNQEGRRIVIDGLYFVSNGRLFDGIEFFFNSIYGSDVQYGDEIVRITRGDVWKLETMRYLRGNDGTTVFGAEYGLDSNNGIYLKGYSWRSDVYRDIKVTYYEEDAYISTTGGSRTALEWLEVLVLATGSGTATAMVLGGDSPFDLFSNAFTSWLPLLNVGVLPGITFGLLLFLPIIAGIIVVIIRVVKK